MIAPEARFQEIVRTLSNYFEIFFWTAIGIGAVFFLVAILLRVREINFKIVSRSALQGALFSLVVSGLVVSLGILGYLFWYNYKHPAPAIRFPEEVLADTFWVKDNLRIYFIDGNRFQSIRINGRDKLEILVAPDPIKEYHFSPDGRHILVATSREIYLIDRGTGGQFFVDSWGQPDGSGEWQGAINGIRWAPDSRHFCYEIARWSSFSSRNHLYLYDVLRKEKKILRTPTRRISSLYWDRDSANLYYLQQEAQDTSERPYAFEVNVFRIPLVSLQPELVTKIPYEESRLPVGNLSARGINLFLTGDAFSFKEGTSTDQLVSDKGQALGIDEEDHLFYVAQKWFRTRLFKIEREARSGDIARHQYSGGDLTITQIRWIRGGRYAIMLHRYFGVLIIEPSTRKIGLLVAAKGNALGWYPDK